MTTPKTLRSLLGLGLLCATGLAARADDTVTFQVDLSRYTPTVQASKLPTSLKSVATVLVRALGAVATPL